MYSMVLMMALTTGGDTPALGHRGGGCGGGGCYGSCYGGGGGGRSRGHRGHGGGGCCGSSVGYGGCYGGGYGSCYGSGMGYGSCYGSDMGYGGGYGGCSGVISYGGGNFSGMSYGCIGSSYGVGSGGCYGGAVMPGAGTAPVAPGTGGEKLKNPPKPKSNKETMAPAPATIVVDLPADAKLLIDNEPTSTTGASRVFVSPDLNPGREYHYTLKAEIVKDGKPVKVERVIAVRAGEITPASLTLPAAGVAQH